MMVGDPWMLDSNYIMGSWYSKSNDKVLSVLTNV